MNRWIPAILVLVLAILAFGAARMVEEPDPPRSFRSVIELGGSIIRDLRGPVQVIIPISVKEEEEIGRRLARPYLTRTVADGADTVTLQEIGREMATQVRRKELSYSFVLLAESEANAFAICGGWVFVTQGMLDFCESEAELAAVIGHELAHIDLGHTIDTVLREKFHIHPPALLRLAYSEGQEREADAYGVLLTEKSGYYPEAGLDLLARMSDSTASRSIDRKRGTIQAVLARSLEDYLGTHPPFPERIAVIEKVIRENQDAWRGKRYRVDPGRYQVFP